MGVNVICVEKGSKGNLENKRKRLYDRDEEIFDFMVRVLLDMIVVLRIRIVVVVFNTGKFLIISCIKVFDGIEGVGEVLYFAVLDFLDDFNLREIFMFFKSNERRL